LKPFRTSEFFAGSGLVTEGLSGLSNVVWSNDISPRKAHIYQANHGSDHFTLADICQVSGNSIPSSDLSWASFPCQDLSLAGRMEGIQASRSGMFWEWLRVIDEMKFPPKVVCLENVVGLVSTQGGSHYRTLHKALAERGYRVGPMMLDAVHWLPQSRRRIFVVAIQQGFNTSVLEDQSPNWIHSAGVLKAITGLDQHIFWKLPHPTGPVQTLSDIVDWKAPCFETRKASALMDLVPQRHRTLMLSQAAATKRAVFPGYRRTRNGKQVLELRFDNTSGCLRTAEGGSSRQFLILSHNGKLSARLLTPREAARLMGAPDSYQLSDNYNDSYSAMGDAVAVPVVKHLAKHLLAPLVATRCISKPSKLAKPAFCLKS